MSIGVNLPPGSVATDTIWDASGDLAVGTGANTAARLAVGTAGYHLAVNSAGTGLEWLPHIYWVRANANINLPNDTNLNPIFSAVSGLSAGSVILPTGSYSFNGVVYVTSMSATSGNFKFDLLGAGTATLANGFIGTAGVDNTSPQNAQGLTGNNTLGTATAASVVTVQVATTAVANISGGFRVTASGTIIPSIQLATASAAVLQAGSYLQLNYLGPHSVSHQGGWT